MEEELAFRSRRTHVLVIPGESPAPEPPNPQMEQLPIPMEVSAVAPDLSVGLDISELLIQKLVVPAKRASQEDGNVPKRQRTCGVASFRQYQLSQARRTHQKQPQDYNIAGLADMEFRPETITAEEDFENTTDPRQFIRDQWGTEGTMVKILHFLKARAGAATVDALLARGPLLPRCRAQIAARCFTSILELKQHGFIKVHKDPETLEIVDIVLGPKFENL